MSESSVATVRLILGVDTELYCFTNCSSTFSSPVLSTEETLHSTLVSASGHPLSVYIFVSTVTTVELQWLANLWDYENLFETVVVRANEC